MVAMAGWYLFFALMFVGVDFPICLPIGDLSNLFPKENDDLDKSSTS